MRSLVVVVAGGAGRRFRSGGGGEDKLAAPLGRSTVLGRLLADLDRLREEGVVDDLLLVGPDRGEGRRRVREDPPGGGPAAALAAALGAAGPDVDVLVLLGADQPFAASAVPRLLGALSEDPTAAGVLGRDPSGYPQPLLSAHRRARLGVPVPGAPLRAAFGTPLLDVALTDRECLDVDTPDDLDRASRAISGGAGRPGRS
ncbi:NTP transferase domain-containing protein [Kineococcus gynurae]|uniref:NTP transferase domain-containing protein n=1 Tax=Kineococcus gynurae TaxID=452979 RepID=A0ABV5LSF0_9ACTN